jgi:hypothetical protein
MSNWITKAAEQFPKAVRFLGDGRYACSTSDGTVVYLAETERQQLAICLGIEKPVKKDLLFPTCPMPTNCSSVHDGDADDRRRDRERRREQQ